MSGMKAFGGMPVPGWLLLCAFGLAGCGSTGVFDSLTSANEGVPSSPRVESGSTLRLARATRQAGDFASSLQIYRSMVAAKSVTPETMVEFGDVLLESGAADDAVDAYSQVDTRSAARLGAELGLVRAYLSLNEPAKALGHADQALRSAPQDARVLVDRGVALDSLGRHSDAQASYRAALETAPRRVSARNNLALSLALTGQYDEAVAIIASLARSSSATPRVRENMAVIYALMGDPSHAATVSRMDLDEGATQSNLAFLASVRMVKQ